MSQAREVWFSEEALISFFEENGDGTYKALLYAALYVQNVSVKNDNTLSVFGQPGAAAQNIYSVPQPYDVSIGELFWDKAKQWVPFLDQTKRWRVLIENINPRYDGVSQKNDAIALRNAALGSLAVNWRQNSLQESGRSFKAEYSEDDPSYT